MVSLDFEQAGFHSAPQQLQCSPLAPPRQLHTDFSKRRSQRLRMVSFLGRSNPVEPLAYADYYGR